MLADESKKRQEDLNNLLKELSKNVISEDSCESYTSKFLKIYSDGFRHSYSKFHLLLANMCNSESTEYVPDFLIENLNLISKYIENKYIQNGLGDHTRLYHPIFKLYDHINLEYVRILEQRKQEAQISKLQKSLEDSNRLLEGTKKSLKDANESLNLATEKATGLQTDILAILSIFSAVVLAFMGSMTFLSGAMDSLKDVRIYKFLLACCICGIVIFNTIFVLLYIVSKIIGKSIYVRCESENCTCNNGKPKCHAINRVRKRLPYVFYFNVLMISFIILASLLQYTNFRDFIIRAPEQSSFVSSQSPASSSQ